MAQYVYIYDEGGIVRVERRDSPLKDLAVTGKKVFDLVKDASSAINPVVVADKYSLIGAALLDAERSERLTEEERAIIRKTITEFDFTTDSPKREHIPGEFERTHPAPISDPGPAAPEGDRVQIGSFDP